MIPVGIIGTSWWADAMYLPALKEHPQGKVVAICGRNEANARTMAERWGIPHVFTDANALMESGLVEAVILSTPNDTHYPMTMKAIANGLHVLCEKPLGLNYAQANEMANAAQSAGIRHMVPFTYQHMPGVRYAKALIEQGFIGQPRHLNLRYYTGYGREPVYLWRFDVSKGGSGAVGDIGSHMLAIAHMIFGEITGLYCNLGYTVQRPSLDPDGQPYEVGDDTAILTLNFASGAQGVIHVTTQAYEPTPFGQTHHMEFHGSGGTLYHFNDWDTIQRVTGAQIGEPMRELPIPEDIWNGARHDTVHNTYRDVFRTQNMMTRQWVNAIAEGGAIRSDFHFGATIQQLIDAAVLSHREKRWVEVSEIN